VVSFQNAAGISLSAARRNLPKNSPLNFMAVGFKSALCVGKDSRNVKLTISFYLAVKKTLGARCSVLGVHAVRFWTQNLASFSLFESSETCPLDFKLGDRHSWRRSLQLCYLTVLRAK
jgi:hypothetical protein